MISETEPLDIRCTACDWHDENCEECNGTGWMRITADPFTALPGEAVEALMVAGDAKRGAWPEAGGTNDQLACVVESVRFIWSEQSVYESRRVSAIYGTEGS